MPLAKVTKLTEQSERQVEFTRLVNGLIDGQFRDVEVTTLVMQRRIKKALAEVRKRVRLIAPGTLTAAQLPQIEVALEQILRDMQADLVAQSDTLMNTTAINGVNKLVTPLNLMGFEGIAPISITQGFVDTAAAFSARLITGLTPELLARVDDIFTLHMLGGQTTAEALRALGNVLPGGGPFGSTFSRAKTILRTESLRVYSIVAQQQLEEVSKVIPGMRKMWVHTGPLSGARETHVRFSGTIVDVDEDFMIAGKLGGPVEALRFPRDPMGSAANTVNCGCTVEEVFPGEDELALSQQFRRAPGEMSPEQAEKVDLRDRLL